jgi:hypothetical protein
MLLQPEEKPVGVLHEELMQLGKDARYVIFWLRLDVLYRKAIENRNLIQAQRSGHTAPGIFLSVRP